MNYDPRFAAVCGDARLPLHRTGRLIQRKPAELAQDVGGEWDAAALRSLLGSDTVGLQTTQDARKLAELAVHRGWACKPGRLS